MLWSQVCQMEHQLFEHFFPGSVADGAPGLEVLMEPLCTVSGCTDVCLGCVRVLHSPSPFKQYHVAPCLSIPWRGFELHGIQVKPLFGSSRRM